MSSEILQFFFFFWYFFILFMLLDTQDCIFQVCSCQFIQPFIVLHYDVDAALPKGEVTLLILLETGESIIAASLSIM